MTTIAYHRGPRAPLPPPPVEPVVVRLPPAVDDAGRFLRIVQVLAPIAGVSTGIVFVLLYRSNALLVIAMAVAVGVAVLVAILSAVAQSRAGRRQRRGAARRYLNYLNATRAVIDEIFDAQAQREAVLHAPEEDLIDQAVSRRRLFERRRVDPDWLEVRLGIGRVPPPVPVLLQEIDPLGPELVPDLLSAARSLVDDHTVREAAPVVIRLGDAGTVVVRGDADAARALARSIAVRAALAQGADDLMVAVVVDGPTAAQWEWVKWLPHARAGRSGRGTSAAVLVADSATAVDEMLAGLTSRPPDADGTRAHLLLVVDGWSPRGALARLPGLRAAMRQGAVAGISVLCRVDDASAEPAELGTRVVVASDRAATLESPGGPPPASSFIADRMSAAVADAVARRLTPLRLSVDTPSAGQPADAPAGLTEALGNASAGGVRAAWSAAPGSLLRVPIGIGADGLPVVVDLKELSQGGMGPHGMLVGAPGAGKSELLRTMVVGLAMTHPPDVLSFVLVDFKGGAAFQPLARLPHVAGIVTNLEDDPTMVERFRLAVEGEVVRRQEVFRAAGNVPDIRAYHRRRAADDSLAPLAYLWLVVDEFAELLATFPDFDAFFEGVARLGRGLGIHVLLATQGVSSGLTRLDRYLSYRICLRTNSVQESIAVIGSPAAAQLPLVPGLGLLRVGVAEPERFAAWTVSGSPARTAGAAEDPARFVRPFSAGSRAEAEEEAGAGAGAVSREPGPAEVDELVDAITSLGAERVHPVWVTPLPKALALDRVLDREDHLLRVGLGLADHPLRQRQVPWGIDFAGQDGHLAVVGAPRSGRSTALRTIICSFLITHDPRDVQFYVVDMGGALQQLAGAPHVGTVAGKSDVEVVRRLVRFLGRLVDEREREMRRLGVGSIAEWRTRRRNHLIGGDLGDAFLVVDNWGAATKAFDWLEDEVTALAGVGLSFGLHVVVSADRWGDIRPALRDRIPARIQLRPIEPGDSLFDMRATRAMSNTPGRALVAGAVQVQIALPRVDGRDELPGAETAFEELVIRQARRGAEAPPIRLLPESVTLDTLDWERWRRERTVPIGISDADLEPVALDLLSRDVQHLVVCGDTRCGKTSFLRALMAALARVYRPEEIAFHLVDVRRGLLDAVPEAYVASHAMTISAVEAVVESLKDELRRRVPPPDAGRAELAARSHVIGPELVLIVDDDDIVDAYALRPLVQAVPVAWDMRFHIVLARRASGPEYDSLASALVGSGATALEMSERDRSLFVPRPVALPPGRAHLVRRGDPPLLLQLLQPGEERAPRVRVVEGREGA